MQPARHADACNDDEIADAHCNAVLALSALGGAMVETAAVTADATVAGTLRVRAAQLVEIAYCATPVGGDLGEVGNV